jgi:AcrR family transcriptional regulator
MNSTARAYHQAQRAAQVRRNGDRILTAAVARLKAARRPADITLDEIARDSGLTVRTVLRRFGTRDRVLEAAFVHLKAEFAGLRRDPQPGDVRGAISSLLDQYEQIGPTNVRALEQEDELPLLHATLEEARRFHRRWLETVFAPQLARVSRLEREKRVTALYAATDIYVWKLLRRDLKQSRARTEDTMRRLVRGALR